MLAEAKAKRSLDAGSLLHEQPVSSLELAAITEGVRRREPRGRMFGFTRTNGNKRNRFLAAYQKHVGSPLNATNFSDDLFLEFCLENGMCNESVKTFSTEQVLARNALLEKAFRGKSVMIETAMGPMKLGIVDAKDSPQIAQGISDLLSTSIEDATVTNGGHIPDHLVDDNFWNITRPEQVQTHWADHGNRFVAIKDGRVLGTVHLGRDKDTIVYMSRWVNNVPAKDYPGFKPQGYHQMVNLAVAHDARRSKLATVMLDAISKDFRDQFNGKGLWMRADRLGDKLIGLGFRHDASMDSFLPSHVEKAVADSRAL